MLDYREAYEKFDLSDALAGVAEDPDLMNAAITCCDRWCGEDRVALRWIGERGERRDFGFDDLRRLSSQYAHLFSALGVRQGDRVAGLLPRTPELLATILATWRLGAVYQPLFTAFGPKAIEHRLNVSEAKLVVTDPANRSKLYGLEETRRIVLTGSSPNVAASDVMLADELDGLPDRLEPVPLRADDPFLMMFTSGTTGAAKGLLVPLRAIAAFVGYLRDAVDLQPTDRFWNIADPGWAYGLYYGVTAPLAMGQTTLFYSGGFAVDRAVDIISEYGITNLAGAPTAFRQFMTADPALPASIRGRLRAVSSAGEPLAPDIIKWFSEELRVPIHDHYGQTELGMVVCNHHGLRHAVTPGSAGFAVPGHRVVVLGDADDELPPCSPGILAIDRTKSPLFWFGGYEGARNDDGRYYRSGDTVEIGENGAISFIGRADDVITSSGYRIGPFDVESALLEHPAVADAAVIGKPDPERTEIVKAFIVLRTSFEATEALASALKLHVKQRLSAHAYPREIAFVASLPRTPSGKVQRFLLRASEVQPIRDA